LTIANAGHIAPYINGSEIPCENCFPLGITESAFYTEFRTELALTDQLTLITDGVAEARNLSGELFGFDRAAELATASAEQIASTARSFGQDDDITFLTLSLSEQCDSA
jgi:serine phosphatase RsbU (regulator of sigma subunit)